MKLVDILIQYPYDYLQEMLKRQVGDLPKVLSHEALILTLCKRLSAPAYMKEFLETSTADERALLYRLIRRGGIPVLNAPRGGMSSGKDTEEAPFRSLRVRGILHKYVDPTGFFRDVYVVSEEMLTAFSTLLIQNILATCTVPVPAPHTEVPPGHSYLAGDLLMLFYAGSPDGIPQTFEGYPHLRFQRQLAKYMRPLDLADDVLLPYDCVYNEPLLPRIACMFEVGSQGGFLAGDRRIWSIPQESFKAIEESHHLLFSLCMNVTTLWDNPQALLRQFIADLIRALPDGTALDPQKFLDWTDPYSGEYSIHLWEDCKDVVGLYLWKLAYCGVFQVLRDKDQHPLLVRTALGTALLNGKEIPQAEKNGFLVVQPNQEILGDLSRFAEVGNDLAPFVEVVSAERTMLLRFTRSQVQKAIHAGCSLDKCREALQKAVTQPVPEVVLANLEEWQRSYHCFSLQTAVLIQADDEEQAGSIRDGLLREFPLVAVTPTLFSAPLEDLPEIRRILKRMKLNLVDYTMKDRGYEKESRRKRHTPKQMDAPEFHSLGADENIESDLKEEMNEFKICVTMDESKEKKIVSGRSASLSQIRAVVTQAITSGIPVQFTLQNETSGQVDEYVTEPICWVDPDRLVFKIRQKGREYTVYLKDILSIKPVWSQQ
ncbi:MAG TPA: helicase-associated domain-containing protein [bacterium]|nr:helicase-associated domain-containing protein [bacterium]HQL61686.1 helicase-associated domain-containing protein [bacterium]